MMGSLQDGTPSLIFIIYIRYVNLIVGFKNGYTTIKHAFTSVTSDNMCSLMEII